MKIEKLYEITFDTEDIILTATMSKHNEMVMLMSSGSVIRFNLDKREGKHLFSVKSDIGYSDGGFDITAKSSIYTLDEIVVVVNNYKRHGFIHYPTKYNSLHLWREDYHADISNYPIALYKSKNGIPHLIYSVAWNHIQIMNLETCQILTASKSLIEENAEERHIEYYKKYGDLAKQNKQTWPSPYDYFFGQLKISPDNKYFLSKGWAWGSCDSYNIYNIDNFLESNRISEIGVGSWEHLNRPACWINEKTVAFGYNPFAEDDNSANCNTGSEIHFCNFTDRESESKIIKVDGIDTISAEIGFSIKSNLLVVFSKKSGVAIISLEGQILFQNNDFTVDDYFPEMNLFVTTKDKTILINKLTD
jgi:hypothetical protein